MAAEAIANGEARVSDYLTARGFNIERFDKAAMRKGRTPDFRAGTLVGGARPEPIYNRITNQIRSAAGQFDSVNPGCEAPNALAITATIRPLSSI